MKTLYIVAVKLPEQNTQLFYFKKARDRTDFIDVLPNKVEYATSSVII
jgi:hypothetical protein